MQQNQSNPLVLCYNKDSIKEELMTSQENLKAIMESMPQGTNEIVHVVLKSQVNKRQYVSLSKNGNNSGGRKSKKS